MQIGQATGPVSTTASNLAVRVRDSLVLNDSVIVECVNEVLEAMPAHTAEVYRRLLKSSPSFGASVKRVTVDIGVILSLAKSLEADDTFAASVELIHDLKLSGHDGKVGGFARAMVDADLQSDARAQAGELEGGEFLYDMVPVELLVRRLKLMSAFLTQSIARGL